MGPNYFGQPYFSQYFAAGTGIAFDAIGNSGYQAASGSYSWTHVVGTGNNQILVVSVALLSVANSVTALTYNGVALTKLRADVSVSTTVRTEIWYLLAPASGSHSVAITLNTANVSAGLSTSYNNVDQANPVDAQNGGTAVTGAGGGSASVDTTTVTDGAWVVDAVATPDSSITVGAGQVQRGNVTGAVGSGGQSDEAKYPIAAGTVTNSWDGVGALTTWTMSTMAIRPLTSSGGTTTSTSSSSSTTTSTSSTSSSISTSTSLSTSSTSTSQSTSSTSSSISTSSTSSSISTSSTSSSTSRSTSTSSTSQSTSTSISTSSTSSSISTSSTSKSTSTSSTSSSTSRSTSTSSTSRSTSTSFSTSSTSASTSISTSSTSSSISTSSTSSSTSTSVSTSSTSQSTSTSFSTSSTSSSTSVSTSSTSSSTSLSTSSTSQSTSTSLSTSSTSSSTSISISTSSTSISVSTSSSTSTTLIDINMFPRAIIRPYRQWTKVKTFRPIPRGKI